LKSLQGKRRIVRLETWCNFGYQGALLLGNWKLAKLLASQ